MRLRSSVKLETIGIVFRTFDRKISTSRGIWLSLTDDLCRHRLAFGHSGPSGLGSSKEQITNDQLQGPNWCAGHSTFAASVLGPPEAPSVLVANLHTQPTPRPGQPKPDAPETDDRRVRMCSAPSPRQKPGATRGTPHLRFSFAKNSQRSLPTSQINSKDAI